MKKNETKWNEINELTKLTKLRVCLKRLFYIRKLINFSKGILVQVSQSSNFQINSEDCLNKWLNYKLVLMNIEWNYYKYAKLTNWKFVFNCQ